MLSRARVRVTGRMWKIKDDTDLAMTLHGLTALCCKMTMVVLQGLASANERHARRDNNK
jgi:hypothetical protein